MCTQVRVCVCIYCPLLHIEIWVQPLAFNFNEMYAGQYKTTVKLAQNNMGSENTLFII